MACGQSIEAELISVSNIHNQVDDNFDLDLVIDDAPNPYEQLELSDNISRFKFIFNSLLSEYQKRIIILKFGLEEKKSPMTFKEIAKVLNMKPIVVKRHYQDAIATIKLNWDLATEIMQPRHGAWYYKAIEIKEKRLQFLRAFFNYVSCACDYELLEILLRWKEYEQALAILIDHANQELEIQKNLTRVYGTVLKDDNLDKNFIKKIASCQTDEEKEESCKTYIESKYGKRCYSRINEKLRTSVFKCMEKELETLN